MLLYTKYDLGGYNMEYDIYIVNPAGNITILVKSFVPENEYIEIANKFLNSNFYNAEQVGYLTTKNNRPHMNMMGMEFCGNASRSFGYLLAMENNNKDKQTISVSVSGTDELLDVNVDLKHKTAQVAMPIPKEIIKLNVTENTVVDVVIMDGIYHAIVNHKLESDDLTKQILKRATEEYDIDAFGIMYVSEQNMKPIVYVKETDSLIYESSCGSGTIAYAYYLVRDKQTGRFEFEIKQPGGQIDAVILKQNNETRMALMGGPITISDLIKVEL